MATLRGIGIGFSPPAPLGVGRVLGARGSLTRRAGTQQRVAPGRLTMRGPIARVPTPARSTSNPNAAPAYEVQVKEAEDATWLLTINGPNRPGLLRNLTAIFSDLGLDVVRAEVGGLDRNASDSFWVRRADGGRLDERESEAICGAVTTLLQGHGGTAAASKARARFVPVLRGDREAEAGRQGEGKGFGASGPRPLATPTPAPELMRTLMDTYARSDVLSIQQSIVHHVEYTLARTRFHFSELEAYLASAYSVRDRLIEAWNDTASYHRAVDPKRVYYLSMEFLMGRSFLNALQNLGLSHEYDEALREMGYSLERLADLERDAALGNGGLGRLAACFLDSMATLALPAWGYGIRYQYGMFRQVLVDGFQHEQPDYWLNVGNPWELERSASVAYPVAFYGHVSVHQTEAGGAAAGGDGSADAAGIPGSAGAPSVARTMVRWNPGETVTAVAYDTPVPGYRTGNTNNLRLWAAKPDREFDLQAFNTGDYVQAILSKQRAETLSSVLYPDDRTYEGKELRLKQQHFFVSATVQDVVRRYVASRRGEGASRPPAGVAALGAAAPDAAAVAAAAAAPRQAVDWTSFADKVAFQLNDTHPSLLVAELLRVLLDEHGLEWDQAWGLVTATTNFTNHTVLPEALEHWPVEMLEKLLPRHMQLIYDVNWRHVQGLRERLGDDWGRIAQLSIIADSPYGGGKQVRMAYLAVVAARRVNGVAAIHTEILRRDVFAPFAELFPEKFLNVTNGVTPRRWLAFCNPRLRELLTEALGGDDRWIADLGRLHELEGKETDPEFVARWKEAKWAAKARAFAKVQELTGISPPEVESPAPGASAARSSDPTLPPEALKYAPVLFDVQVKRIHEYKRQLLNVLGVVHRYLTLSRMSEEERRQAVPRFVVLGGKAAPGYEQAKRIIKLVSAVADRVNGDPAMKSVLRVAFVPDYNVSLAEILVPGTELSQHISTAGTEASGTGNMKFAMNGALIIGTADGANIEIAREIGPENVFTFGATADEVPALRRARADDDDGYAPDPRFVEATAAIRSGHFGWPDIFAPLLDALEGPRDYYLLGNDFAAYLDAQAEVDRVYKDQDEWTRRSILSTVRSGFFSSDRTISEYASNIWGVVPVTVPLHDGEGWADE